MSIVNDISKRKAAVSSAIISVIICCLVNGPFQQDACGVIALCRKRVFAAAWLHPLTRPPLIKLCQFQRTRFLIQLLPEAVQEKASGPADILAVAHHARVALLTSSTSSFLCRLDPHLSPVTHVGGSAFTVRARSSLLLWT